MVGTDGGDSGRDGSGAGGDGGPMVGTEGGDSGAVLSPSSGGVPPPLSSTMTRRGRIGAGRDVTASSVRATLRHRWGCHRY
jgi:hypothetical protein